MASKSVVGQGVGFITDFFTALRKEIPRQGADENAATEYLREPEMIRKITQLLLGIPVTVSGLLTQLATVCVPAVQQFVAKDHFIKDSKVVKFYHFGGNFKNNFLGKTEDAVPEAILRTHSLKKNSLDLSIILELGNTAETSLAHFWYLLTQQPNGETGTLLTNGSRSIFYIRDANSVLWTVYTYWYDGYGGWSVYADSVGHPLESVVGSRVVSR
jgi:hypothetical protein